MNGELVAFAVGIIAALGGAVIVFYAIKNLKKAQQLGFWPTVTGEISKMDLTGRNKIRGEEGPFQYRSYIVDLAFEYEVNNKKYTGDKFYFGSDISVREEVMEVCSRFKVGDRVTVYYNQDDPEEAILMKEKPGGKKYSDLWMGILVIITGIILIIVHRDILSGLTFMW